MIAVLYEGYCVSLRGRIDKYVPVNRRGWVFPIADWWIDLNIVGQVLLSIFDGESFRYLSPCCRLSHVIDRFSPVKRIGFSMHA